MVQDIHLNSRVSIYTVLRNIQPVSRYVKILFSSSRGLLVDCSCIDVKLCIGECPISALAQSTTRGAILNWLGVKGCHVRETHWLSWDVKRWGMDHLVGICFCFYIYNISTRRTGLIDFSECILHSLWRQPTHLTHTHTPFSPPLCTVSSNQTLIHFIHHIWWTYRNLSWWRRGWNMTDTYCMVKWKEQKARQSIDGSP